MQVGGLIQLGVATIIILIIPSLLCIICVFHCTQWPSMCEMPWLDTTQAVKEEALQPDVRTDSVPYQLQIKYLLPPYSPCWEQTQNCLLKLLRLPLWRHHLESFKPETDSFLSLPPPPHHAAPPANDSMSIGQFLD